MESIIKRDFHVVAQVSTALRSALTTAKAAGSAAKDRFENIADVAKALLAAAAVFKRGMAVLIVRGTFLRIFQTFIGLADFLEFGFGVRVAGVAVGMPLHGKLAIGRLERRAVTVARHLQKFVIIGLSGHSRVILPRSARISFRRWPESHSLRRGKRMRPRLSPG